MTRYLLSCSFRPKSLAAVPLLDALAGGTVDAGRVHRRTGVVTRGWVHRDRGRALTAYGRLMAQPGVWAVTLDEWEGR